MIDGGRVALITGADRGIGLALATLLGRLGHRAYLSALPGRAEATAARLAASGVAVFALDLGVADDASVEAAVGAILEREDRDVRKPTRRSGEVR